MPDPINLNRVRKARAAADKKAQAAVNRVAHGRTKAERTASEAQADAAGRKLDAHKRDRGEPEPKR